MLLSGVDIPVTFTGKALLQPSISNTGPTQIAVTAASTAIATRLKALGDCFEEFRFKKVVVKMHPSGAAASSYSVSYHKKEVTTLSAATFATSYEATASRTSVGTDTVPQTLALPPSVLRGGLRVWYATDSTEEVDDFAQGVLIITTNAATAFTPVLEIGYEIEFRGATIPAID
jgi:hypothetical protein